MRFFTFFFLLFFSFQLSVAADEPIVIQKTVTTNPKILFRGVGNQQELTEQMGRFLRASGWFDTVNAEPTLYTLDGRMEGNHIKLELGMGGAPVGTLTLDADGTPRELAKRLVDAVLEQSFKNIPVRNFCQTRIAFAAETGKGIKNIYTCDIDGGDVRQLTHFPTLCVEPSFFPDGRSVGYTRYTQSGTDVLQTQIAPHQTRRLTALPGLNVGVAFSPDGENLALISSSAADHMVDLYVKALSGGPLRRLTRDKAVEASPVWSPDGKKICFVSDESGIPKLHLINADGTGRQRLPALGGEAVTPDWSSDDKIAYATRVGGEYTLAVLDLKTGKNQRATTERGNWESPAWAPDNRQLVCKRDDGGRSSLYIVDTLTGKSRKLLSTNNNLSMPAWSKAPVK